MKKSQDVIYYISGESQAVVESSPFMERLNAKGYEVLYLVEPLDEYSIQQVTEYDGKKLQSITKEGLQIGKNSDKSKARQEEQQETFKPLCDYLQAVYGSSKVEKVIVSSRVSQSPAVLVTGQFGWSANMERIMKAQALGEGSKNSFMIAKRTLEINPRHPIIKQMNERVAAKSDADTQKLKDLAALLYDAAALNSGFSVDDTKEFGNRVYRVLASGLDVSADAPLEEEVEEEESEEESSSSDDEEEAQEVDESATAEEKKPEAPKATPSHDEL
jgi:HSP90 family molecular chaperone